MGCMLVAAVVPIAFILAALAVDIGHVSMVRTELQNAADAAALAGAHDIDLSPEKLRMRAEAVAGFNTADGRPVSNSAAGTDVQVAFIPATAATTALVRVTVLRRVKHFFASIFGRTSDQIMVRATASSGGRLSTNFDGMTFPLALTADRFTLNTFEIGDTIRLVVTADDRSGSGNNGNHNGADNGNHYGYVTKPGHGYGDNTVINAAFVQFLPGALEQSLGMTTWQPGVVPAVKINDSLSLNDIDSALTKMPLPEYSAALMAKKFAIIPVVTGDPASVGGHNVIGFLAVKFTYVGVTNQKLSYLECTLIKVAIPGTRDYDNTSVDGLYDATLTRLSPEPIRLVYNS
jgi:Flp pilus assembly protein TadG